MGIYVLLIPISLYLLFLMSVIQFRAYMNIQGHVLDYWMEVSLFWGLIDVTVLDYKGQKKPQGKTEGKPLMKWFMQKAQRVPNKGEIIKLSVTLLLRFVKLHKLKLKAQVGLGEAYPTAFLNGVGWGIIGMSQRVLSKIKKSSNYQEDIDIMPIYDKLHGCAEFFLSYSLRGYQSLYILFSVLFLILKRRFLFWKIIPLRN